MHHMRDMDTKSQADNAILAEITQGCLLTRTRRLSRLVDQSLLDESLDRAVEGARAQAKGAARARLHVIDDAVAVTLVAAQRKQDVERGGLQGEQRLDVHFGVGHRPQR